MATVLTWPAAVVVCSIDVEMNTNKKTKAMSKANARMTLLNVIISSPDCIVTGLGNCPAANISMPARRSTLPWKRAVKIADRCTNDVREHLYQGVYAREM